MAASQPPLTDEDREQTPPVDDVLTLLAASHTQAILKRIHHTPESARGLADACDASRTTVYRRLNRLEDAELIESRMTCDPDGHHRTVFETTLESITLRVTDAGFAISIDAEAPDQTRRRPHTRSQATD